MLSDRRVMDDRNDRELRDSIRELLEFILLFNIEWNPEESSAIAVIKESYG